MSKRDRKQEEPKKKEPEFRNSSLGAALSKWKQETKKDAPKAAPVQKAAPPPPPPPRKTKSERDDEDADALFRMAMEDVAPVRRGKNEPQAAPLIQRTTKEVNEDAEALAKLAELVATGEGLDLADTDEYVEGLAHGADPSLLVTLRRGDFSVQAHVDLHGMLTEQARDALERFLVDSRRKGLRCVLVVHGRGLHSKDQLPIIKTRMQAWLSRGRLSRMILAFATARPVDGGAGAMYALLRR